MKALKVKTYPVGTDSQAWVLVENENRTWVRASEILGESVEKGIFSRLSDAIEYGQKALRAVNSGKKVLATK